MKTKNKLPFWLGIDLAQRSMDVCAAPDGLEPALWRTLAVEHIPHSPGSPEAMAHLARWIKEHHPRAKWQGVCVEATGRLADRLASALDKAKLALPPLSAVNPARPKNFARSLGVRDKTDKVDAKVIAVFAATHRPEPQPPCSQSQARLEEINRQRENLVNDRTAWINRQKDAADPAVKKSIQSVIDALDKQIKSIQEEMDKVIQGDCDMSQQVKILKDIDGIGEITAITLTAELGCLDQYTRTQLTAAAGLQPVQFESGHSVRKRPRMAKGGGQRVRRVLFMCAMAIIHHPKKWQKFITRLGKNDKPDIVIIGAIMRKLLLVARAAVKEGQYIASKIGKKQKSSTLMKTKCA